MDEHEKAAKAAKQVEALTGFDIHLVVFVLVNVALFVVSWLTTPSLVCTLAVHWMGRWGTSHMG